MARRLLVTLAVAVGSLLLASSAAASPVLVMGPGGRVVSHDDPFVPSVSLDPLAGRATPARASAAGERTVRSELKRLLRIHAISQGEFNHYDSDFTAALSSESRLKGTRKTELTAITVTLHNIAASGRLTPSRLRVLFLILERNRQWWTTGPLLSSGQRVEFAGSELVWEYYPGQGIQLQPLGSFGKADSFFTAGRASYPRLSHILSELTPLAAVRGGGLAWEYYFSFDGGSPPWTSALSQGIALEALSRAYLAFHRHSYLALAKRAVPIFNVSYPLGVRRHMRRGSWYLLYSFAPGALVLNGFLGALVGLWDYARRSGNGTAWKQFAEGDREARAAVPHYDTGSWSLYQPGVQDTVDYHRLVTQFLHSLCARTHARVYCVTAEHFDRYLAAHGG